MRTNPVKTKLRAGQPTFGTWLSLGDLYATRVMARAGFDWLTWISSIRPSIGRRRPPTLP